jgi:hypothetical protein
MSFHHATAITLKASLTARHTTPEARENTFIPLQGIITALFYNRALSAHSASTFNIATHVTTTRRKENVSINITARR